MVSPFLGRPSLRERHIVAGEWLIVTLADFSSIRATTSLCERSFVVRSAMFSERELRMKFRELTDALACSVAFLCSAIAQKQLLMHANQHRGSFRIAAFPSLKLTP